MRVHDEHTRDPTRRALLGGATAMTIAATVGPLGGACAHQQTRVERAADIPRGDRLLFKGGTVLTMDRARGDFAVADVLVEGGRISKVGRGLDATRTHVIACDDMIVMPGFVDTHRHMWEGQLRNSIPDALLPEYMSTVHVGYGTTYRPEDAYIGDLLSAWSALDAGITTVLDWSHVQNTPAHADAIVQALQETGIRAVFAYGYPQLGGAPWWTATHHAYPGDIRRLRSRYFNSEDQLLTLALAATGGFGNLEMAAREWGAAREVGARITVHAGGKGQPQKWASAFELGPDTTYVHCGLWDELDWKMVADSGGTISLSPGTETLMSLNIPPFQQALDVGLRPSLSADAETNAPNDMFTQMRLALASQHMMLMARRDRGEKDLPPRLLVRDVLELATVEGARANGLATQVGSIAPGKQADLILLRKDRINVMPINDPVGAVVTGMDTSNVDSVFVAGTARKWAGQLVDADLKRLQVQALASRDYLERTRR